MRTYGILDSNSLGTMSEAISFKQKAGIWKWYRQQTYIYTKQMQRLSQHALPLSLSPFSLSVLSVCLCGYRGFVLCFLSLPFDTYFCIKVSSYRFCWASFCWCSLLCLQLNPNVPMFSFDLIILFVIGTVGFQFWFPPHSLFSYCILLFDSISSQIHLFPTPYCAVPNKYVFVCFAWHRTRHGTQ